MDENPYTSAQEYEDALMRGLSSRDAAESVLQRLEDTHAAFPELADPASDTFTTFMLAYRLREAAKAYYDGVTELMDDAEYDAGVEILRATATEHPEFTGLFDDLLNRVAGGQSAGGDIKHPTFMGSLDKVVGLEAVRDFVHKVQSPVVVEPKLDGLPIRVVYTEGILTLAATRGDGRTGENVTEAVMTLAIQGLPHIANAPLAESGRPVSFEVRGEVFLADVDFVRAQKIRESLGGDPFKNQRNSAAGILRKGDAAMSGVLSFAAYDATFAPASTGAWTHDVVMNAVERSGITTARSLLLDRVNAPTTDPEQVVADIAYMGDNRPSLGFPIDGAVIKAATVEGRIALGEGTRAPRWAMAFKYPPIEVPTTVVAIHATVGKTGRLGLQIELVPVMIDGSLVAFASGHNVGWIERKDIRVGDTVVMMKRGDVIPYLDHVILEKRPADAERWDAPATDPLGNAWDKSTLLWRSTSPELSIVGAVRYAAARDALDIEGAGEEIVTALVEGNHVNDVADLFTLDASTLATLPLAGGRLLGEANARKVAAEIVKAKTADWSRVITALSLRGTGRSLSRRLARSFPTMGDLRDASVEELADVEGIGPAKAAVIREGLNDLIARGVLDRLAAAGVNMGSPQVKSSQEDLPFAGKIICVSGTVPGLSRNEANEAVESLGGKSTGSISTKTSLLIAGEGAGSKLAKAQSLGVEIMDAEKFASLVANARA